MKKFICAFLFIPLFIGCGNNDEDYAILRPEEGEQFSGGVATVNNASEEAFGFAYTGLNSVQDTDFGVGNSFFRQSWVSAPSSTTLRDGLGPYYNAIACASCHFKDGRGRPPMFDGELGRGLLLRLSIPGADSHGGPLGDPVYGGQLQDNAILGPTIKGQISITYQTITETFDDGTTVQLQKPIYTVNNLGYGPLASGGMISPRIANQIIGLGLLEAVPEATFLGFADENDSDGDGISGRPNYVYDIESNSQKMGRFGWKANQPTVKQQVAAAFLNDMGITSYTFPNDYCPPGVDCGNIPNGGTPEIEDATFDRVVLYSRALSVPIRRKHNDPSVLKGKQLFKDLNCVACHKPKMQTGSSYFIAGFANQTIRPYTDLLLHDMGPELADNATDYLATGSEWRTPPLWGIGLVQTVNGHTNFMHDGRARNITEAILWHGGEAKAAKEKFKKISSKDREDLLKFLNSL
ncbi:di-heme oxidoreductase family protein [Flavobacterium hauense]